MGAGTGEGGSHSCAGDEDQAESFKLLRDLGVHVTDQLFSIFPKKERLEGGRTEVRAREKDRSRVLGEPWKEFPRGRHTF